MDSQYTLRDNFIISNAYCGPRWAQWATKSLILFYHKGWFHWSSTDVDDINTYFRLITHGNLKSFTPWLLGFQISKSTFRAARFMSTVFFNSNELWPARSITKTSLFAHTICYTSWDKGRYCMSTRSIDYRNPMVCCVKHNDGFISFMKPRHLQQTDVTARLVQ